MSSRKIKQSEASGTSSASSTADYAGACCATSGVEEIRPSLLHTSDGSHSEEDDIFEEVKMILRKRRGWGPNDSLDSQDLDLLGDDDVLAEEDEVGCPLPSTPEDTQLIEAEVSLTF